MSIDCIPASKITPKERGIVLPCLDNFINSE